MNAHYIISFSMVVLIHYGCNLLSAASALVALFRVSARVQTSLSVKFEFTEEENFAAIARVV